MGPSLRFEGALPPTIPRGSQPISPSDPASAGRSDERLLTSRTCFIPNPKGVKESSSYWYFRVSADRFLRNMVRAIVGTLIEVGKGKISTEDFRRILESGKRTEAGESVPAKGLFLEHIDY